MILSQNDIARIFFKKLEENKHSCLAHPVDGGAWWAAVHGVARSRTRLSGLHFHFSLSCIGEGNGNPLQCSCLENPRDRRAWQADISGVAQSWTQLKRLSSSSSMVSFVSFTFISALIFKIYFLLQILGFFISSFSSCFKCSQIIYLNFFLFLEVSLNCYEPSPQHCFYSVPHVLGCCVFISFVSMHILISSVIPKPDKNDTK